MPEQSATFDTFVNLIAQIASVELDTAALTRESTLAGDLMLDSISLISLMALTEERFGISVAEHTETVANMRTLGDVLDLIKLLTAAPVAAPA